MTDSIQEYLSNFTPDLSLDNYLCFLLNLQRIPDDFSIPKDYKDSLKYCFETFLYTREAMVVQLRYFDSNRFTLEEIGTKCNVTGNRIRDILNKALRKMRGNNKCKFILYHGIESYQQLLKIEAEKIESIKNSVLSLQEVSIEDIFNNNEENMSDIKTRTYNCCKRAGINTLHDLLYYPYCHIRNMGKASVSYAYKQVNEYMIKTFHLSLKEYYMKIVDALEKNAFINILIQDKYVN